ncbi:hypothetical protein BH20ACI4_BH20ACI4_17710 [soil metagenome]
MNKKLMVNLGIALVMLCACVGFLACGGSDTPSKPTEMTEEQKKAQEGREALATKKEEYTTIPAKEQLAKEPYRIKSLIFFRFSKDRKDEPGKWVINDFGFGTDSDGVKNTNEANSKLEFKLAENPDEVGTIALLPECKEVSAGSYTVGSDSLPAYKEHCELILIDPELSSVVYRKIFEGELESIKTLYNAEKSVTAKVDRMKIVDFLNSLTEKDDASPAKTDKK